MPKKDQAPNNPPTPTEPPPEGLATAKSTDDLKKLVEKNIKWSQVIYSQNKAIKRRLTMMVVGSYIKLLIIVAPIILAIIYLPPIINDLINEYQSLISSLPVGDNSIISNINLDSLKDLIPGN